MEDYLIFFVKGRLKMISIFLEVEVDLIFSEIFGRHQYLEMEDNFRFSGIVNQLCPSLLLLNIFIDVAKTFYLFLLLYLINFYFRINGVFYSEDALNHPSSCGLAVLGQQSTIDLVDHKLPKYVASSSAVFLVWRSFSPLFLKNKIKRNPSSQ